MEKINFNEWQKFDFRVAKILEAEDHPNADKLFVLKVSLGDEQRTIVAGIKSHYKKEELIGKKIIVFTNLEPAVLRGVKSEGMLLAAVVGRDDNVVLITPEKDIPEGTKVS